MLTPLSLTWFIPLTLPSLVRSLHPPTPLTLPSLVRSLHPPTQIRKINYPPERHQPIEVKGTRQSQIKSSLLIPDSLMPIPIFPPTFSSHGKGTPRVFVIEAIH